MFRITITPVTAAVTIFYLIPLFFIAFGYTTKVGEDAPSIESLEQSFPFYPVTTLREAIKAMRIANVVNQRVHDGTHAAHALHPSSKTQGLHCIRPNAIASTSGTRRANSTSAGTSTSATAS